MCVLRVSNAVEVDVGVPHPGAEAKLEVFPMRPFVQLEFRVQGSGLLPANALMRFQTFGRLFYCMGFAS